MWTGPCRAPAGQRTHSKAPYKDEGAGPARPIRSPRGSTQLTSHRPAEPAWPPGKQTGRRRLAKRPGAPRTPGQLPTGTERPLRDSARPQLASGRDHSSPTVTGRPLGTGPSTRMSRGDELPRQEVLIVRGPAWRGRAQCPELSPEQRWEASSPQGPVRQPACGLRAGLGVSGAGTHMRDTSSPARPDGRPWRAGCWQGGPGRPGGVCGCPWSPQPRQLARPPHLSLFAQIPSLAGVITGL